MYRGSAPRRQRQRERPRPTAAGLWLAGFTAVSLLMLLVSATEPVGTVQRAAGALLDPVRQAVAAAGETVTGAFGAIGEIGRLREENEALRGRLAAAEQRASELAETARENAGLRELLGIARSLDMELLPVRVSVREPSNFVDEVSVDAGSDAGVRAGMPVLGSADGAAALVGIVVETTSDDARIRFIVDPRSVVIGLDQESRALGEVRGQAGRQLVLANVPLTERLTVGDVVISAGITVGDDASRFPGGLLLGRIQAVEPDGNGLTQTAYLRPAVDPIDLERLMIVVDWKQG